MERVAEAEAETVAVAVVATAVTALVSLFFNVIDAAGW
jgi:hypothetical protein